MAPAPSSASRNSWVLPLGTYAGIPVEVHATFGLLLAFVGYSRLEEGLGAALAGIAAILAIFACVVLHEYGHALAARRYGVRTRKITLLPIGGVAQLEGLPSAPAQELVVALAGPAVNLVIATLTGATWLLAAVLAPGLLEGWFGSAIGFLTIGNAMILAFNLLPAFPMDGGRVLRAALALRLSPVRATEIAAWVGKAFAVVFGLIGVFSNPFLLVIALFVWLGASAEARQVRMQAELEGVTVGRAMATHFVSVSPDAPLEDVLTAIVRERQQHFPVVEDDRVVGLLLREDVEQLAQSGRGPGGLHVRDVMRTSFEPLLASAPLSEVAPRLFAGRPAALPVLEGSRLIGWLTREGVQDYLALRARFGRRGDVAPSA